MAGCAPLSCVQKYPEMHALRLDEMGHILKIYRSICPGPLMVMDSPIHNRIHQRSWMQLH